MRVRWLRTAVDEARDARLTKCGTIEPTALLRALADRYEPARGFGRGMKIALAAFDSGSPWETCAFIAWPEGNGGAVRIAPVAAARWPTQGAFDLAVRLATRVTHAHEDALAFARLQAVAIAVVLDDAEVVEAPAAFKSAILARLVPAPEVVVERLELVFDLVGRAVPASEAARELGTGAPVVA